MAPISLVKNLMWKITPKKDECDDFVGAGYSNLTKQVVALKEIRLQEEEGTPFTAIRYT